VPFPRTCDVTGEKRNEEVCSNFGDSRSYRCRAAKADEGLTNERWPDGPCRDVQQLEAIVVKKQKEKFVAPSKTIQANAFLGVFRRNLLVLLGLHCGVNIQAKLTKDRAAWDADIARMEADVAVSPPGRRAPTPNIGSYGPPPPDVGLDSLVIERPQRALNCVTLKLDSDLSTTNCN
jgi:hypothetical protein